MSSTEASERTGTHNTSFVDFMEAACAAVNDFEERAGAYLAAGNADAYRQTMQEKAVFLQNLATQGQSAAVQLPEALQQWALQRLARFSASAASALQLNSVFYMSALLFPEDHRHGEPNDLDVLTAEVRERCRG